MTLAFTSKIYNYKTTAEAQKHMDKMRENGWTIRTQQNNSGYGWFIYENGGTDYPFSVEYYK